MKTYTVGEKVKFTSDEFDGHVETMVTVVEVNDDLAIAKAEGGKNFWIDEDTDYMFTKINSERGN